MTRLRDDQTGGEGRGVRIPVGIGAGFCGYPCGYICGYFCGYQCGYFCGYQCGYFATTRQQRRGAATMRRRRAGDDGATTRRRRCDATTMRHDDADAATARASRCSLRRPSQSLQVRSRCSPHGAPHRLPYSRCRSQFAAAPQSLQPPSARHSRFSPQASQASLLLFT